MKKNIIKEKSFLFAIETVKLSKALTIEHIEFVISKQKHRSGTSIGANVREAQNAISKKDFKHEIAYLKKTNLY